MTNERMAEVLNAHADSMEKQPSAQLLSRTIEREMLIPALRHGAQALNAIPSSEGPPPETVEQARLRVIELMEDALGADAPAYMHVGIKATDTLIAAVRQASARSTDEGQTIKRMKPGTGCHGHTHYEGCGCNAYRCCCGCPPPVWIEEPPS